MKFVLGTAQFDENYGIVDSGRVTFLNAQKILKKAFELKIIDIDTSPLYGNAEKIIGNLSYNFNIHSKISSLDNLEINLNQMINNLNIQKLKILYLHNSNDSFLEINQFSNLLSLKGEKYESLGISIYEPNEIVSAIRLNIFDYIQIPLNVFNKVFNKNIRKMATDNGVKLIARSIFMQGILTKDINNIPKSLMELSAPIKTLQYICFKENIKITELCLRWILSQEYIDGFIVGVVSPEQLSELFQIYNSGILPENILSEINEIKFNNHKLIDPRTWIGLV